MVFFFPEIYGFFRKPFFFMIFHNLQNFLWLWAASSHLVVELPNFCFSTSTIACGFLANYTLHQYRDTKQVHSFDISWTHVERTWKENPCRMKQFVSSTSTHICNVDINMLKENPCRMKQFVRLTSTHVQSRHKYVERKSISIETICSFDIHTCAKLT
jgi:hypothetical protein